MANVPVGVLPTFFLAALIWSLRYKPLKSIFAELMFVSKKHSYSIALEKIYPRLRKRKGTVDAFKEWQQT